MNLLIIYVKLLIAIVQMLSAISNQLCTKYQGMKEGILVKVENVSKKFCRSLSRFVGNLKRSLWYGVEDISSELFCITKNDQRQNPRVTLMSPEGRRRVWDLIRLKFTTPDSSHLQAFAQNDDF